MGKYCIGINSATGKQCHKYPIHGSEYCPMHHPDRQAERYARAKKGGPSSIVGKLEGFKVRDSSDTLKAISVIIENIISQGKLTRMTHFNVLNSLARTQVFLEQNSEVPKLIKKVEAQLAENGKPHQKP